MSFPDRPARDSERDHAIEPPPPGQGVGEQADEDRSGQVGAQQVLGAFPGGGGGAEPLAEAALGDAERRFEDEGPGGQREPDPALLRVIARDQALDALGCDVGREQVEADGD